MSWKHSERARVRVKYHTYAYVYMAKNIAVSDDVYKLLSRLKLPEESFSDTIRRLAKTPKLGEIAGTKTITKEQWRSVQAVFRKQEEKDLERRRTLEGKFR
jgi:predicted CopG family antitoxin